LCRILSHNKHTRDSGIHESRFIDPLAGDSARERERSEGTKLQKCCHFALFVIRQKALVKFSKRSDEKKELNKDQHEQVRVDCKPTSIAFCCSFVLLRFTNQHKHPRSECKQEVEESNHFHMWTEADPNMKLKMRSKFLFVCVLSSRLINDCVVSDGISLEIRSLTIISRFSDLIKLYNVAGNCCEASARLMANQNDFY